MRADWAGPRRVAKLGEMARVGIYGWGIVAPRSPNVEAFASNLESAQSWLTPFYGFGPSTFLAGEPALYYIALLS